MLTISLDRVIELLDKAAEVEVPEAAVSEDGAAGAAEPGPEELDELLADDPAYGELVAAIERLSPGESGEVLALALLARNAATLDEWQAMVEQARALPEAVIDDELLRTLLLTDELETALEQLGYLADDEEEPEEIEDDEAAADDKPEAE